MKTLVAPSILSADFGNLDKDIALVNESDADWFHLDIMDGVFVPNISFGFPVIEAVAKKCEKPMDVHLMIVEPQKFISKLAGLGVYMCNVHYEACTHLHRTVQQIKAEGMKAAVTLNPHTPVSVLEDILGDLDMVLLMGVNPGFGGQAFIENTINKVKRLKAMITHQNLTTLIQIDGGVNGETGTRLVESGADVLVAGSYVFGHSNPKEAIQQLKNLE